MSMLVQVRQGKLCGVKEKNIYGKEFYAFRGIPYTKPPIGELRFKDPELPESWTGVRDAKKFGNIALQYDNASQKVIGSEDCLFLNIYTNTLNPMASKSVLVWIHGGAWIMGSGNDDMHGPDYLMEKNIVLVTINYRLGILGFLNLDDETAAGNQALKDQVMALRWVQQNIDKFGGDVKNVTIFGDSAGAASVHYLTLSPLAKGLFHKAIIQSGVATNPWGTAPYSGVETAVKISLLLGKKITDTKELIEYLRTVDATRLVEAERIVRPWKKLHLLENPFVPSIDSKSKNPFLNIPVEEAAMFGIQVPHIIGYTSHEGIIILPDMNEKIYAEVEDNQEELLLHPNIKIFLQKRNISVKDIKNFFMGNNKISNENVNLYVDLMSAVNFLINIQHTLETQLSISNVQSYVYKFEYFSKDTAVLQKLIGTNFEEIRMPKNQI
ncbi:esterase FE4-like isoform X2 [Cotesia glomerata]|uniref:esterase FE4-like isoform X2 n=1 Tax=Cotesia glomerata TaxID=32391 RepID=UPI001D02DC73|nr:esterase FE4-like isoform X2 [Cotesia glomerata]